MICTGCNRGVPIDMLQTHSKKYHRGRAVLPSEKYAQVMKRLSDVGYQSSDSERYHQSPGQKPVDGLEVLSGFRCPLLREDGSRCAMAFLAKSTLTRHLSDHTDQPKPKPDLCVSGVQTLFNQRNLRCYFSVDRSLSNLDPSPASAYTYAIQMLETLPKANIPTADHDKDRASIHWFTRWPELLQPYITNRRGQTFLHSLVSFPETGSSPDWLMKLRDHGCRWWDAAELAHIKCSHRASVILKSHQQ